MQPKRYLIIPIALGLVFFCLYLLSITTTPSGIADADELTATSYFLSVPHPPGFPLFTIIGHFGIKAISLVTNPAHASNIMSTIYTSVSLVLFFLIGKKLFNQTAVSLIATVIFGLSYLVWMYATVYEITSFTLLLSVTTLFFASNWHQTESKTAYYLTWVFAGLLLSHYHLAFLYFPALLWLIIEKKPINWRMFIVGLAVGGTATFIGSLGLFLLNTDTPFSWDLSKTWQGWWHHLMRKDYQGLDIETNTLYQNASVVPNLLDSAALSSVLDLFQLLVNHFTIPIIIVIVLGANYLWKKNKNMFWFYCLLFCFSGPLLAAYIKTANYTFQTNLLTGTAERQFMLGELSVGMLILPGLLYIKQHLRTKQVFFWITLTGLTILQFIQNSSIVLNNNTRSFNYNYQKQRLLSSEPNSLIICITDIDCYTLWYLSRIENIRSDVDVLSHVPAYSQYYLRSRPDIYPFTQYQNPEYLTFLIANNQPKRPIFFSSGVSFYDKYLGLEDGPFFLSPKGSMFHLSTKFPTNLQYVATPPLIKIHDSRERYPLGIMEAIANSKAYAGYLGLKYSQPETAKQFLNESFSLDQNNLQTRELLGNFNQIMKAVSIIDPQLSSQKLISAAADAEKNQDYVLAEQYFRYALLIANNDAKTLSSVMDFYNRQNDATSIKYLNEMLIYNNRVNQVPE